MFFKSDNSARGAQDRGQLPLLPLRDIIVFPHMVSQLFVGRDKSIAAFLISLGMGADYASENYQWFEKRGTRHQYIEPTDTHRMTTRECQHARATTTSILR